MKKNIGRNKPLKGTDAGNAAMDRIGLPAGLEYLERYLIAFYDAYENSKAPEQALKTVLGVAAKVWSEASRNSEVADKRWSGVDPHQKVGVPWWAVEVIASAYASVMCGEIADLSYAFGMGRSGRGKRSPSEKFNLEMRDRKLALAVVQEVNTGTKTEFAVEAVAAKAECSRSVVWRAWERYGEEAKRRLDALCTRKG